MCKFVIFFATFYFMITKADIQLVRSLTDKRSRYEHGLFVAEGAKLLGEILDSDFKVQRIFARDGVFATTNTYVCTSREMERLSQLKTPSEAVALVEIPRHKFDTQCLNNSLVLALDQVQNPGNVGTIIRLADWFGIEDIICSEETADCFNPKVVQATMGAILRVRVHYLNLASTLMEASKIGAPICGTFLEGDNIYKVELPQTGVIVMGNEGKGISSTIASTVTNKLYIPPYPADCQGSESLNVAIATGIICAEFRRRG